VRRGVTSPIHPTADSRLIRKTRSFQLARQRIEGRRPPSRRCLTSAIWGAIVCRVGAGLATPKARFEFIGSHVQTSHRPVIARASADYMRHEIADSWTWLRVEVAHADADFFHRDPDDFKDRQFSYLGSPGPWASLSGQGRRGSEVMT